MEEFEKWVNEIEEKVWEGKEKEESESWVWGDYEIGIVGAHGVKLKDEDVRRARSEEVGFMKSRPIWNERTVQ